MAMISKDYALRLWKKRYGGQDYVRDCFGVWIFRDDYNDPSTKRSRLNNGKMFHYGWAIDHIYPKSQGGNDNDNNLEIMHIETHLLKADSLVILYKHKPYQVRRIEGKRHYAIFDEEGKKVSRN